MWAGCVQPHSSNVTALSQQQIRRDTGKKVSTVLTSTSCILQRSNLAEKFPNFAPKIIFAPCAIYVLDLT